MKGLAGRYPWIRSIATLIVMFVAVSLVAHACPNCGLDVVAEQKGGAGLKDGFTYSIMTLASMPFLVFAGAGGFIIRAYRNRSNALPRE